MLPKLECAFVTYSTREAAEKAVDALYKNLVINKKPLQLAWGRSHNSVPSLVPQTAATISVVPPPAALPAPASFKPLISLNYYPSMNPTALGATGDTIPDRPSNPPSKR